MIYALLVGINRYQSGEISDLYGCVNDVERVEKYLSSTFNKENQAKGVEVETLTNNEAKRQIIIDTFREHLGKANKDDIALFYFSGHGCRELSPSQFIMAQGSSKHENIVCYDSEMPGKYDIADKELNLLIKELEPQGAEAIVIFDCCHAGSGTRKKVLQGKGRVRLKKDSPPRTFPDDYLPGSWTNFTRSPRHLLMAACSPTQSSKEEGVPTESGFRTHGIFTHALISSLESKYLKGKPRISYENLMYTCKHFIQSHDPYAKQTPQLEVAGSLDARKYFLSSKVEHHEADLKRIAYIDRQGWKVPYGSIHGLQVDARASFHLFKEEDFHHKIGTAQTKSIGLHDSPLSLLEGLSLDPDASYYARPSYLPIQKLNIHIDGIDTFEDDFTQLTSSKELTIGVPLPLISQEEFHSAVDIKASKKASLYEVMITDTEYMLRYTESGANLLKNSIARYKDNGESNIDLVAKLLQHLAIVERMRKLNMPKCDIKEVEEKVELSLYVGEKLYTKGAEYATLDFKQEDDSIEVKITAHSISMKPVHINSYYISPDHGVLALTPKESFTQDSGEVLLDEYPVYLPLDEADYKRKSATDMMNAVFSHERLPYLNLGANSSLQDLHDEIIRSRRGQRLGTTRHRREKTDFSKSWFSKKLLIKTLADLGEIGPKTLTIADNQVTFAKHTQGFKARVGLASSASHMYGPETDQEMKSVWESKGFEFLDFSPINNKETILEIHHINHKNLISQEHPLNIQITVETPAFESLYALTLPPSILIEDIDKYPGDYLILGKLEQDSEGKYSFSLKNIPPNPADGRDAPNNSLKISFLRVKNEQQKERFESWLLDYKGEKWIRIEE